MPFVQNIWTQKAFNVTFYLFNVFKLFLKHFNPSVVGCGCPSKTVLWKSQQQQSRLEHPWKFLALVLTNVSVRFELDSVLGLHDQHIGGCGAHGCRGGGREAAWHWDEGGGGRHGRRHPLLPHLPLLLLFLPSAVFPPFQASMLCHLVIKVLLVKSSKGKFLLISSETDEWRACSQLVPLKLFLVPLQGYVWFSD